MTERKAGAIPLPDLETEQPRGDANGMFDYLVVRNRADLDASVPQYIAFGKRLDNAALASSRIQNIYQQNSDRLDDSLDITLQSLKARSSSATVSAAYMKFTEEFGHLSQDDLWDLFTKCLLINNQRTALLDYDSSGEVKLKRAYVLISSKNARDESMIIRKYSGSVPAWFRDGQKTEWTNFLRNKSNFPYNLNPEYFQDPSFDKDHLASSGMWLGSTFPEYLPDWYDEKKDPDIDIVAREFEDDKSEFTAQEKIMATLESKKNDLDNFLAQKNLRVARHFENERRRFEAGNDSLYNLMLYLEAAHDTVEYPYIASDESIEEHDLMVKSKVEGVESQRKIIARFIEDFGNNPECVALWMEGNGVVEGFTDLRECLGDNAKAQLDSLRGSNRDLQKFIQYSLLPAFSLFTDEERDYLQDVSRIGSPFEFIEEFAMVASVYLKDEANTKALKSINSDLQGFVRKWIARNNDGHFTQRVRGILESDDYVWPVVDSSSGDDEVSEMNRSAEEQEEEFAGSSLPAWSVNLIRGYNPDDLIPVAGQDIEEFERNSNQLFRDEGQAFSADNSGSIVRALDWFLRVPDDILAVWPKVKIKVRTGEVVEYYRLKEGKVYVYCLLDKENKDISFFTVKPDEARRLEVRF